MSPEDSKTCIFEEFHDKEPRILYDLTTLQSNSTFFRLGIYVKLSGDIPSLKSQTKHLIKSFGSLIKIAQELTNSAITHHNFQGNDNITEDESLEDEKEQLARKLEQKREMQMQAAVIVEKEDPEKAKLDELLKKLGPFQARIDMTKEAQAFTEVYSITNWPAMFHRYKPQYMPQIKRAVELPKEFERKWALPEWKQVINDKKVNLQVWQRTTPEGLQSIKATAIINRSTQQIFRVIGDDNYRHLYDPTYESGYFLERIADQTFLIYHKTKKVAVVGPRDFVLMLHFNLSPEGTIYAIVTESGLGHLVPESKNIVRGLLPMGGWKLEPLKEDPTRTRCEYIAEIDLKGYMPAFIMSVAIKD
jgi:hypothetical protein